ncbi:hypothetical protein [Streptomyces sp. NPDC059744]|uniref:hypothetical protein n=1 Tax=Streptomyces sp. NPDC059744 TaxID=3346929 RepID=UPI00365218E4
MRVHRTESGGDQRADADGPVRRRAQATSFWLAFALSTTSQSLAATELCSVSPVSGVSR